VYIIVIITDVICCKICDRQRFNSVLLLHSANKKVMQRLPLSVYLCVSGASTPYKRWSKCTMEKVRGGGVLQKLSGEVH